MRTDLVLGPPGTGKTTYLLNKVDEAIKSGILPERIGFFAFTKKAAEEAKMRAFQKFGDINLPYFRTLHSLAFKLLKLSRSEVMRTEDFKELGEILGSYTFSQQYGESMERLPREGALGDICMSLYSLQKAEMIAPEEAWRKYGKDLALDVYQYFVVNLERFKNSRMKLDFTDFMSRDFAPLDLDLLIIDEAQDLTRQQWRFAKQIGKIAIKVIIAGDDDQSIFKWSGADLKTFLGLEGNKTVLPKSFRLPRAIYNVANDIVGKINFRYVKDWEPSDREGQVTWVNSPEDVKIDLESSWLLLARQRYQLFEYEKMCRNQGIPYILEGQNILKSPDIRVVFIYEKLRKGDSIDEESAKLLAKYVEQKIPEKESYTKQDFYLDFEKPWFDALHKIGLETIAFIRKIKQNNISLLTEPKVRINTIHSVKGGEADNVILLTEIPGKTYKNYILSPDDEHRVWYVAVSRAKEKLFIVQPRIPKYYNF